MSQELLQEHELLQELLGVQLKVDRFISMLPQVLEEAAWHFRGDHHPTPSRATRRKCRCTLPALTVRAHMVHPCFDSLIPRRHRDDYRRRMGVARRSHV